MTLPSLLVQYPFSPACLPERIAAQADWRMLDMAKNSPSLGLAFSNYVSQVTLITPDPEVCRKANENSLKSGRANITCQITDLVSGLPFDNSSHQLIASRHGSADLGDIQAFLTEVNRVLTADGKLLIIDDIVPGSHLKGKKARKMREAGSYVNAVYKFGRSGLQNLLSQDQWQSTLWAAGFQLDIVETAERYVDIERWVESSYLSATDLIRLRVLLIQAPEKAREFLTPQWSGDRIRFRLTEILILASKTADTD